MSNKIKGQFKALIHLDEISSSGAPNIPMHLPSSRPMALSIKDRGTWYGFVITRAESETLNPGQSASFEILFMSSEEASAAFPLKSSFLFGDGASSKGVVILVEKID